MESSWRPGINHKMHTGEVSERENERKKESKSRKKERKKKKLWKREINKKKKKENKIKIVSFFIGPDLPDTIYGSAMVQHPNGGVVLLIRSKIYQLSDASSSQWKLMWQTVSVLREWTTAFLIPDEIVSCFYSGK